MGARRRGPGDEGPPLDGDRTDPLLDSGPSADEVDALIEAVVTGATDTDTDRLTAGLTRLRAVSTEPLPEEVRDRHLARIRGHRETELRSARGSGWWVGRVRRHLAPLTAGVAALAMLAGGGAVAVAQDAGPEDALYGVKIVSERAWASLPRGPDRAAEVRLALADRRMGEAGRSSRHAERLLMAGLDQVEQAAGERPELAVERFIALLGEGEDALPPQGSDRARAAIHRDCVRIATRHDLGPERCGPPPDVAHPGRGHGTDGAHRWEDGVPDRGQGPGGGEPGSRREGQGPSAGHGQGPPTEPRGWGPEGRPEGHEGPPPRAPGQGRWEHRGHEGPPRGEP
jgi:hypothetical protein